jgi:hypothetical protein
MLCMTKMPGIAPATPGKGAKTARFRVETGPKSTEIGPKIVAKASFAQQSGLNWEVRAISTPPIDHFTSISYLFHPAEVTRSTHRGGPPDVDSADGPDPVVGTKIGRGTQ